jgi:hypothetical protein
MIFKKHIFSPIRILITLLFDCYLLLQQLLNLFFIFISFVKYMYSKCVSSTTMLKSITIQYDKYRRTHVVY